jgi:hypothetical protein
VAVVEEEVVRGARARAARVRGGGGGESKGGGEEVTRRQVLEREVFKAADLFRLEGLLCSTA